MSNRDAGDTRVYAWGRGAFGALGLGAPNTVRVPAKVGALDGKRCRQVAAGEVHTAFLTPSHLLVAGTLAENCVLWLPVNISAVSNRCPQIATVAAGESYTAFLEANTGKVFLWPASLSDINDQNVALQGPREVALPEPADPAARRAGAAARAVRMWGGPTKLAYLTTSAQLVLLDLTDVRKRAARAQGLSLDSLNVCVGGADLSHSVQQVELSTLGATDDAATQPADLDQAMPAGAAAAAGEGDEAAPQVAPLAVEDVALGVTHQALLLPKLNSVSFSLLCPLAPEAGRPRLVQPLRFADVRLVLLNRDGRPEEAFECHRVVLHTRLGRFRVEQFVHPVLGTCAAPWLPTCLPCAREQSKRWRRPLRGHPFPVRLSCVSSPHRF